MVIRSAILRKSIATVWQIPRAIKRFSSTAKDFEINSPVISNSFPKSGTHLLLQILESLPGVTNYGSFISSMPTLTFKERSKKGHVKLIQKVIPGEVVPAHLFYDELYEVELNNRNCIHYFIFRDLRDVVISEVHYLTFMNRWHRMHSYFAKSFTSLEDRISSAILGVSDPNFSYDYPDIAERFSRYLGWWEHSNVCAVKYEDLMGERRETTLRQMAKFWVARRESRWQIDELVQKMEASINPKKSHTYRKGKIGAWRDCFSETHKEKMKSVAGDLLVELGYEEDLNW
jgi:hypothetical protein